MSMNDIVKKLQSAVDSQATKAQPASYDTPAEVRRIENGTVWVHIPGGVDETPVRQTISCSEGDTVQVRVSGGNAWLQGNQTAPPTDDTLAKKADDKAGEAIDSATMARTAAQIAESSAQSAQANAAIAKATTDEINNYADSVSKTVTQVLADGETAGAAAQAATEAADSALYGLSTVEDVVGVLNWITAHGTMTLTSDVTVNPAHVYFVVDAGGDYVVGGTHYSIVSEPKDAELSTYYELTVDESVQNYVATHIVVDTEGLWIVPDSGGNKVLIATGAGSTYTTAGTYIVGKVGGVDTVLAEFTASGATIGQSDDAHVSVKTNGIDFFAKENAPIGTISSTAPVERTITVTDSVPYNKDYTWGYNTCFCRITDDILDNQITISASVTRYLRADSSPITATIDYEAGTRTYSFEDGGGNPFGATLRVYIDTTQREVTFEFTDTSGSNNLVGADSAVSYQNVFAPVKSVFGNISDQQEYGDFSVALNNSIAKGDYQTSLGKYNEIDDNDAYALIIGNGTDNIDRNNALTVDWNGGVKAGELTFQGGTGAVDDPYVYTGGYNDEALMTWDTIAKWLAIVGYVD